jgi:Domain of unknown function (DUF4173)
MELKMEKIDWIFLLFCLLTGILAEESFFRYQIGVSYLVFIAIFYTLFFWRFRSFSFSHQRLGYLVLIAIWLLAACYYLYDTAVFYALNILVIPALVIFHLALVTSPKKIEWSNLFFVFHIGKHLVGGILYSARIINHIAKLFIRSNNEKQLDVWKKILIGILISVPLLFIILNLLIEADTQFERLIGNLPHLISFRVDYVFRLIVILIYTFGFFGFMQVLLKKKNLISPKEDVLKPIVLDGIITLTVLLLFNLVYILFIAVQFKYFFSGTLEDGFTYAEYARRGFFELLFVSLINLSITIAVITFTKTVYGPLKKAIRLAMTVLVLSSGVLLVSAIMRISMYEDAYGFTFTRVLAHSFMVFLMVILAYTFVKIWLEKLSLFHFYFIASLIYYVGINTANLDKIVVDKNMARFETTGKIDIHYLSNMSATGILGLMKLYEKNPDVPGLEDRLKQIKAERGSINRNSWQSHNLERDKVYEKLEKLSI